MPNKKVHSILGLCVTVHGFIRSAIYDLQFGRYYLSFDDFDGEPHVETLMKLYKAGLAIVLDNNEIDIQPLCDESFDLPSDISNAIIELNDDADVGYIINEMEKVNCRNIQIVIPASVISSDLIARVVQHVRTSSIIHCELVLSSATCLSSIHMLTDSVFPELAALVIYDATEQSTQLSIDKHIQVTYLKDKFCYAAAKNRIDSRNFRINTTLFMESQHYNTYYNRKIFIDLAGNLRPGPISAEIIGSISDQKWLEVMTSQEKVIQLWACSKDKISVCNVCEFRHMCVDMRIPKKHTHSEGWYHDSECNYNPFIAKWQGEAGYLTLSQCGVTVSADSLMIDHELLKNAIANIYYE